MNEKKWQPGPYRAFNTDIICTPEPHRTYLVADCRGAVPNGHETAVRLSECFNAMESAGIGNPSGLKALIDAVETEVARQALEGSDTELMRAYIALEIVKESSES